jgi:hypothetical protein
LDREHGLGEGIASLAQNLNPGSLHSAHPALEGLVMPQLALYP